MGEVNGCRENLASERDFEPTALAQGAQPSAKNGRIPGPFGAAQRTERLSAYYVLAEGEELSPNPLRRLFNGLQITQRTVDVAWRILNPLRPSPPAATTAGAHCTRGFLIRAAPQPKRDLCGALGGKIFAVETRPFHRFAPQEIELLTRSSGEPGHAGRRAVA
jgi:hypothetical protein